MKRIGLIAGLILAATLLWSLVAAETSAPPAVQVPVAGTANQTDLAGGPPPAGSQPLPPGSADRQLPVSDPAAPTTTRRPDSEKKRASGNRRRQTEQPWLAPVPAAPRRLPPVPDVSPAVWSGGNRGYVQPAQLSLPPAVGELLPPAPLADGVTLHLNEVDVRQAFELLSRSYGVNVLVAPGVNGLVTANFEQVTVEEAINAILKLCGLVALREANLLYVYSADDYPQADQFVRVFALDFCSAADLMPAVQGLLTKSGQAFVTEVSAENNRRTQEAIMVSDMPSALGRIEQYIIQMDQPPRQVMIEAHVLEIELGSGCRHGIDYESLIKLAGGDIEVDIVGFADPLASPAAFARIKGGDLDSLLHIIKTTTDAKTLASPRLMVVNGQKARMQVGEQLGFKVITVTETASVEEVKFLDVGVVLEVTPQISRGNRVMLNVRPKVSTGAINPDTELPEEQTSELQTDVLLEDGEGVVIGGLIQETDVDVEKKLPVLGELYLIGWLFRKWEKTKKRTETIITLVPRVCVVDPEFEMRNAVDAERSRTPLLQGPLEPYPRPWEPVLPGTVRNPRPLWKSQHIPTVPSLNLKSVPSWDGQVGSPRCEKCNCETCICPPPAITPEPIADPDRASPLVVPAEEPDLRCSRLPTYRY